jgi:hypothetical protein
VSTDGLLGKFLASEIDDLKRECRRHSAAELESIIAASSES